MPTVDGKLVSDPWATVLGAARRNGVAFRLNSGRRTMAEQRVLRAAYERFLAGGPRAPEAAVPNCRAPHIDCNQQSHALDVENLDGGVGRLVRWIRARGAQPQFTVAGEPWHIEVPEAQLLKLAGELADPLRFCTPTERRWCREYDRLKAADQDRPRRGSLRRAMKSQRKRIWRAAQDGGWEKAHRRERYEQLMKRTRR
jgi:hypothetical protein